MKLNIMKSLIIAFTLLITFANSNDTKGKVAIVFNGKTSTNNHAIEFIEEQFKIAGYVISAIPITSTINPKEYKAVVVLNSGIPAGIDQTVLNFILKWPNKEKLFVANLYTERTDMTIIRQDETQAKLGVDGITSATIWKNKGFLTLFGAKNPAEYDMHINWTKQTIEYIDNLK